MLLKKQNYLNDLWIIWMVVVYPQTRAQSILSGGDSNSYHEKYRGEKFR